MNDKDKFLLALNEIEELTREARRRYLSDLEYGKAGEALWLKVQYFQRLEDLAGGAEPFEPK